MDLRNPKTFLHLAEGRHFGRSARAMHVSPSTLSRQVQRLEEDLDQPLFVRDNRTVTLTETGEELRVFTQQTLLQYQQLRRTIDQQGPSLSDELHILCPVTAAHSHLPPILGRSRTEHPPVEIKPTTDDVADAMEKVVTGEADLTITGKPETLPGAMVFSMLENLIVALIAPALLCPVRNQVLADKPDWSIVPFIMADQEPVHRRIELQFRRDKTSSPMVYTTVGGHGTMVSMVALGCGVASLPEVVLGNNPEPVCNRVMILERNDEKTPFEPGVCVQKKQLHEPLIEAFWEILPDHQPAKKNLNARLLVSS